MAERLTTRERRERRADRLEGWAEAREAKQAGLREAARTDEAATGIPFGQPILVGHHSEGRHRRAIEKTDRAMRASIENARKAEGMANSAGTIRAQNEAAIYDDDADAIERLEAKLAELEAERERIKAYNRTARAAAKRGEAHGDLSLLTDELKSDLLGSIRIGFAGKGGTFPAYKLSNLGGVISTTRKRLEAHKAGRNPAKRERTITARYSGTCADCGAAIEKGQQIRYSRADGARCAEQCTTEEA